MTSAMMRIYTVSLETLILQYLLLRRLFSIPSVLILDKF